ncbi:MAG TPA: hypothetical protein PKJ41_05160 [Bryobacteraceae bacterium]|nr:hypothetical protein [Bryobacteraceae bacterium]
MRLVWILLLCALAVSAAEPPIYHFLWFDTEDFIDEATDDDALRLAEGLAARGIPATFKLVGAKTRGFVDRKRGDVLKALSRHDIGYHTEWHSVPPHPAMYMDGLGLLEGAAEFERRETDGFRMTERLFGVAPSCYGQPGGSWVPQANLTLRKWGVKVYMDDGMHVGFDDQPFWYGGLLYIFNLGPNAVRTSINSEADLAKAIAQWDAAVKALKGKGGGVMQTYYHPTEFSTTEFWDAVNFRYGASPQRADWKRPAKRTAESRERAYKLFFAFIDHVAKTPGLKSLTARQAPAYFRPQVAEPPVESARKLASSIDAHDGYSAAELVLRLLRMPPAYVDGPTTRLATAAGPGAIAGGDFDDALHGARGFIAQNSRLPDAVWAGSRRISIEDFAATLAADEGKGDVTLRRGVLAIEKRITTQTVKAYSWVIHPKGFAPEALLDLARLQTWTLKPARLR